MLKCDKDEYMQTCIIHLIGSPKNVQNIISFAHESTSDCVEIREINSPYIWARSANIRNMLASLSERRLLEISQEVCILQTEQLPQIISRLEVPLTITRRVANHLNHALFHEKSMEITIEKSGESFLAEPEIVGIPKNIENVYERGLICCFCFV